MPMCYDDRRRSESGDANLSIWSSYILPMLPGAAMMLIAMAFMPALGPVVTLFWAVGFTAGFILTGSRAAWLRPNKRGSG